MLYIRILFIYYRAVLILFIYSSWNSYSSIKKAHKHQNTHTHTHTLTSFRAIFRVYKQIHNMYVVILPNGFNF